MRSKEKFALHDGIYHSDIQHIGLVYISPQRSASGRLPTAASPYREADLTDVLASDCVALVAGDFNARTGSASGIAVKDYSGILDISLRPDLQPCHSLRSRTSDDHHSCAFGKTLLDICETSDLCILNGCASGDPSGRMTCRTAQGSSVVDCFLASAPLISTVHSMTVSDKSAELDHCPLTLGMMLQPTAPPDVQLVDADAPPLVSIDKIKYRDDSSKIDIHRERLLTLLHPVFAAPAHQCCLASALQPALHKLHLKNLDGPVKSLCRR